ncbi:MAG: ribosomal-protein-alanine N-acetyltransferase [Oceanospirillaceae bacterium]|jgi:ribosomal-protein-alanine N-acetyltransferase
MPVKPDIITVNGHSRLINTGDTAELANYYSRNRTHLAPWEPTRTPSFYKQETMLHRILEAEGAFYADKEVNIGVFNPQDHKMIASIDFSQIVRGPMQACFVGYSIDAQYQGQGLMQEFMPPCLDYMFHQFNIHRIMATYMTTNQRSAVLLERLGFEKEGYAKSYLNIAGTWEDHVLMALVNPQH